MEKIIVNTKAQLDELEKGSALTFFDAKNTDKRIKFYFDWIKARTAVKRERVYIISGWLMNLAYGLTEENAYKDDLAIFCIKLSDIKNVEKIFLPRFKIGGRWFDDVIDNNARRQKEIDG